MDGEITLKSKDGAEVKLSKKNAELSTYIKDNMEDNKPLDIKEVDEKTLKIIVDFLNHYAGVAPKELEKPLKTTNLKEILDEYSCDFLDKLSVEDVSNLNVGANYMEIQCLLDIVCAKVAVLCKDKTDEEIITLFNIKETFTEEEKTKIRDENKWIEENL